MQFSRSTTLFDVASTFWKVPVRNTIIVARENYVRLAKKGEKHPKDFLPSEKVLKLAKNTETQKTEKVQVILTAYVEGLGDKGAVVSVKPLYAHHKLLLPKLAVYASPENLAKYNVHVDDKAATYSSLYVAKTMELLSTFVLSVVMSKDNPWTVEPWHVRASFRKAGLVVPTEAITMPKQTITGPDMEKQGKEFYVIVTINDREKTNVRCRIHHWGKSQDRVPYEENFWRLPSEPIFLEDADILSSIPRPPLPKDMLE